MISLSHKFIFIHIPKTAGNSIQNALKYYSEDKIVCLTPYQDGVERFEVRSDSYNIHKHSCLKEYKKELGELTFQKMFKFTCVRNPWDRMISFFFSPHRGIVKWDKNAFLKFIYNVKPINYYLSLSDDNINDQEQFKNVDMYLRFENIDSDFAIWCSKFGIPCRQLSIRNKSVRKDYREYYDTELIKLVQNRFSMEIEYFGYQF
ncbi:MAG: sulfotransferase family 2 domain-containing protein [Desulfobacterales bacterium]